MPHLVLTHNVFLISKHGNKIVIALQMRILRERAGKALLSEFEFLFQAHVDPVSRVGFLSCFQG